MTGARPTLRALQEDDAETISRAFAEMGWSKPAEQYRRYAREQDAGEAVVLVAEREGAFAGYVKLVWRPDYPPLRDEGAPEIQDLNVVAAHRRRGVASALMDRAEALAAERSDRVGLGVGLHPGYNAAQVLYARRGYIPDGLGVTWRGESIREGDTVVADDDLVLHLVKDLRRGG